MNTVAGNQPRYTPAAPRNIRAEVTNFMLENPACTKEDLKISGGFSDRDITTHAGPASEAADRRSKWMESPADRTTKSALLEELETARHPNMSPEEIEAQRRSWVIGELMLDDPELTREEANSLYDQASREGA